MCLFLLSFCLLFFSSLFSLLFHWMFGFYDCSYDRTKEVFLFLFKSRVVRINESAGLKRFLSLCRRWFCCCFPLACGPSCAAVEDPVTSLPKRQHGVKATGHGRATRAPGFSRSAPRMLAEDIFRNSRSVATPRHGPAGRKEKHVVTIVMGDLTPLHPHCPRADMTHTTWMEFPPRLWISLNCAEQVADSFFFDNSAVGGRGGGGRWGFGHGESYVIFWLSHVPPAGTGVSVSGLIISFPPCPSCFVQ